MIVQVGIVTFHCAYNYGAVLQCYALKTAINRLSHDACVIDYWPPRRVKARSLFQLGFHSATVAANVITLLRYAQRKKRRKRFDQFRQEHLQLSDRQYLSYGELQSDPPACNAFVCGSDQVWEPSKGLDPAYFLQFAKDTGARRIAYAPSIIAPSIAEDQAVRLKEYVSDIHCVSVRERHGSAIIKGLTGRDAQVVLDPVLLLSVREWTDLVIDPPISGPYILVYALRSRKNLRDAVQTLKERTGWPVVVVPGESPTSRWPYRADTVVWDAGPREFLGLMRGAAFVCTHSFHGTAFSVLFRKPFAAVSHTMGDPRLVGLLERIGLSDRLFVDPKVASTISLEPDYDKCEASLAQEVEKSTSFLRAALKG